MSAKDKNPDRKNGKAWKKSPGRNPSFATGRTIGGFSQAARNRRMSRRFGNVALTAPEYRRLDDAQRKAAEAV